MEKPVRSSLQNLGIAYECALAIGNSLNLSEMLHEVIHTMVHKTNAHRGIIWAKNGEKKLQPVASAGINIEDVLAQGEITDYHDVLDQIQKRQQFVLRYKNDKDFLQYCPVLTKKEECVLIVPVTNVAILHLIYASREIAYEPLANLLTSLSKKLSVAIEACMAHKNIIDEVRVRVEAEEELKKKTDQLIFNEKELQKLYGESEQARKSLLSILEDVTQKEEALRKSEEKFRLLAENSIDCIWMLDTKLRFTYLSPSVERILGFKPEQLVGTKLSSHFKKKEFLKVGALAAKGITNYKTFTQVTFETKMLNSKNDEVDIEISGKVLLNSQGKLVGLQGTTKDITERKRAQKEIEMLLALSRRASAETSLDKLLFFIAGQIVDVIPHAEAASIFLYDEERKVLEIQAWAGFSDNDVKGLEFDVDGSQAGKIFRARKPTLISNTSDDSDYVMIGKPTLDRIKSQIAVPLIIKKRVVGIIYADNLIRTNAFSQKNLDLLESIGNQLAGVIENARLLDQVSEKHKQLRQIKEQYRSVVDDSPGLIDRFLPDGTITFVNQECRRFFGKTYAELIGTNIQSSIPEEDRESVMSNIASLTEESPIQTFENKVIRHDGEVRWMRWIDHALFDDKGQKISIQSFGEDITASKQADEKEQRHFKNIAFLTATAMQFVDFPPEKDIYRYVGERLRELAGESIVAVNSIDQAKGILTTRAVAGLGKYAKDFLELTGRNPEGIENDANDENLAYLIDGELHVYEGGLYGIFLGIMPKPVCRALEKLYRLNEIYTMGFVKNARLFGSLVIFLPQGVELKNKAAIKLFIEQSSIAIQHKQAEQALLESEEQYRTLFDSSRDAIMIETPEEGFLSGNPAALKMFGCRDIEEFISQTPASLSPEYQPDGTLSTEATQQNNAIAMKEGAHYFEWVHKCMDGQEFPATVLLTRMELQGREILHATVRDITEQKRIDQAMILMSDTQRQIVLQKKSLDIYQMVGKKIQELIGNGYVITTMYDEQIEAMKVIGVNGFGDRFENLVRKLKFDPFKSVYYLKDMSANHLRLYRSGKLEKYKGGLYNLLARKVPKQICNIAEKELNATSIYVIGFTWNDLGFGGVTIFPKGDIAPFKDMIETIMNQAAISIKRIKSEEELRRSEQKLRGTLEGTIQTIALTVEVRDPYTAGHQTRVSDLAAVIAREMKLTDEQVEGVKMAGMIHDLGKIRVPAEILSKPGKLSELEFDLIKTHPQVGFDLLKNIEFPWPIAEMVQQHHERMDGSGYPQGLKGEKIILEARILAVADVVEAMSSHRPYRPAYGIEKALKQIKQDKGTLLDPNVVDACLKLFKGGYQLPED